MMPYKRALFLLICFVSASPISALRLSAEKWHTMQELYRDCMQHKEAEETMEPWYHPFWKKTRQEIGSIILNNTNPVNFLSKSCIVSTMVRIGYGIPQLFEETYLKHCVNEKTKKIISGIRDTTFGDLPTASQHLNCSTSTLGHIFSLARILEHADETLLAAPTIVEVGGGYGNLARITKQAVPQSTYIIIDIPEMSALQWYFLQSTSPALINFVTSTDQKIVQGAINIVPLSYLEAVPQNADIFVSTFALSECTQALQKYVSEKQFFGASFSYITGQLEGWGEKFVFEQHTYLIDAVRGQYQNCICQPFHFLSGQLQSYEIMASKRVNNS